VRPAADGVESAAGGNVSSKIDTLDPHGGEPLAILLASIVAQLPSHDFVRLSVFLPDDKTSGDIARHAQQAIADVPLGVARGGGWAQGTARLGGRLLHLREVFATPVQRVRALGISALQTIRRSHVSVPRLRLSSLTTPAGIKIGAGAALATLASSLIIVHLSGRLLPASDMAAPSAGTQAPAAQSDEERPTGGVGVELTRANLRYCTFQQIRLEALGPITEGADLVVFNALVQDWNGRCTRFRYRTEDKDAVDAEAAGRHALLEVEGRALMNGWRRKIVTTVQQRPVDAGETAAAVGTAPEAIAKPSNEAVEPLPLLITLGRSAADEADRDGGLSLRTPSLALLRADVATRVQRRLNDLGYTIAPVDGTWGTASRNALRRFKQANNLLINDAFDAETVARLFSTSAITAAAGERDDETAAIETVYPPPQGGDMNPLNRADGQRIQQRLADLGYYSGRGEGAWGNASRAALRSFKAATGLRNDEEWDGGTEAALFDEQAVRAAEAPAASPRNPAAAAGAPVVPLPPRRPPPPSASKATDSVPALAPRDALRPPALVPAPGARVSGAAARGTP
jgi:peptidoglycan hydrolase-like protein with peptidoglycan-binding domain